MVLKGLIHNIEVRGWNVKPVLLMNAGIQKHLTHPFYTIPPQKTCHHHDIGIKNPHHYQYYKVSYVHNPSQKTNRKSPNHIKCTHALEPPYESTKKPPS